MVSRRRFLQTSACLLSVAGGCLGTNTDDPPSGTERSTTHTQSAAPTTATTATGTREPSTSTPTPTDDLPEWTPTWSLDFDRDVLGLDTARSGGNVGGNDGPLYAVLSDDGGDAAVAAVDPAAASIRWRTTMAGEAVPGSHAGTLDIARNKWGTTVTDRTVYAVAGRADSREWTRLHALDRATGERRWTVESDRRLSVEGTTDDLVVVSGLEFYPPPGETVNAHDTPDGPLTTVVRGVDRTDGSTRWRREFEGVEDVAVGAGRVAVATDERLVGVALDGSRSFVVERGPAKRVAAGGGRLYYHTGTRERGTLFGVSPSGAVDWRHDLPLDDLLVVGDTLYATGGVVARVEADGTVAWRDGSFGTWPLLDPDGDTLYTRSGRQADGATAYDVDGEARWRFTAPPATDGWPEAATADALVASVITAETTDSFLTVFSVDSEGRAQASLGRDTVFDAVGLGGTVYLADGESSLHALDP